MGVTVSVEQLESGSGRGVATESAAVLQGVEGGQADPRRCKPGKTTDVELIAAGDLVAGLAYGRDFL